MTLRQNYILRAPEGDGDGDSGGGLTPEQKEEAVNTKIAAIADAVGTLAGSVDNLQKNLPTIVGQVVAEFVKKDEKTGSHIQEDMDLEKLDRKEFAAVLMTQVMDRLQTEVLKPLTDKIDGLGGHIGRANLETQIKDMAGNKADFLEWKTEVVGILKEKPNLSVKQAYALARDGDPDKAAKMDKKYYPPKEKTGGDAFSFLGLTPGSSRTVGTSKMDAKQAAEAAWEKVMSQLPGS